MAPRKKEPKQQEGTEDNRSPLEKAISVFNEMDSSFAGIKLCNEKIEAIDTGSPVLNDIIGIGGYPRGRITQIYGPQGAGKTFLALIAIKNMFEANPNAYAVWFDAESSFPYDWAKKFGIWSDDPKKNRLKIIKSNKGKDIFERIVGKLAKDQFGNVKKTKQGLLDYIKSGELNCPIIVIDSLADIISPREETAPVGGLNFGALAVFLTNELKRISSLIEETNTALICINQVRQNIDEAAQARDGKYHYPGGENLGHKMSLNILVDKTYSKESAILVNPKDMNTLIGRKVKITLKKNRFGPSPRTCETTLLFTEGCGFDKIGIANVEDELITLGCKYNLIQQAGAWYTYKDYRVCGAKDFTTHLQECKDVAKTLYEEIKATSATAKVELDVVETEAEDGLDKLLDEEPME